MLQYFPSITGSLTVNGNLVVSGSIFTSGSITISGSVDSASYAATLQGLGSASFAPAATFNVLSSSYAANSASLSTRLTTDESNFTSLSSSFATTSGSVAGRVTLIEGQYATTGSNNFTKPQQISDVSNAISFTSTASLYTDGGLRVKGNSYMSGTAYFNDVVVYGTSSIEYITSSQIAIGTNLITLNTDTPSIRYGGISVYDSGSNNLSTGSLFWDSEKDKWIYSNPSGSTYDGGMLISGPRNTSGLGNEVGTTSCAVMIGQGGDHITSSAILHYSTATCFYGQSFINSSGTACFSNTVCASSILVGNTGTTTTFVQACTGVANARLNAGTSSDLFLGRCDNTNFTNVLYADSTQWTCAFRWSVGMRPGGSSYTVFNEVYNAAAISVCQCNNYVGINCTTPLYQLDVNGTVRFSGKANVVKDIADYAFTVTNTNASGYGMYIQAGNTNNAIDVYNAAGTTQTFKLTGAGAACFAGSITAGGDITIPNGNYYYAKRNTGGGSINVMGFPAGSDTLTIKGGTSGGAVSIQFQDTAGPVMSLYNGNVGIGVACPTYPLTRNGMTIKASGADGVELVMLSSGDTGFTGGGLVRNGTDLGLINRTAGCLIFATNATEKMWLTSNGNLLLGSNVVCRGLLKVAGDAEVCKTLFFNGGGGSGGAIINTFAATSCAVPSYNLKTMFCFNNQDNYGAYLFIHTGYNTVTGKNSTITGVVNNGANQTISILATTMDSGATAPSAYSSSNWCITFCWPNAANSNTQFIALAG